MIKILIIIGTVLITSTSIILLAGCASTRVKRVSGDEFIKYAEACEYPGSMVCNAYIGTSDQNAYVESAHAAFIGKGNQTTVYWVPLSELPKGLATQLERGNPPWTNWYEKIANQKLDPTVKTPGESGNVQGTAGQL